VRVVRTMTIRSSRALQVPRIRRAVSSTAPHVERGSHRSLFLLLMPEATEVASLRQMNAPLNPDLRCDNDYNGVESAISRRISPYS
jgi:hypothetical protein